MILLLGGIRESREAAGILLDEGCEVLFCTATDMPFPLPDSTRIQRRSGELDRDTLTKLLQERPVRAVLDVTHPYAAQVTDMARQVCRREGVPFFCYLRPPAIDPDARDVTFAADHREAARLACEHGDAALLTIGTRRLEPYVRRARSTATTLYVRILPRPESRTVCRRLGLDDERIVELGQADSVEDHVSLLQRCAADVLVTKDSGTQGGTRAKLLAARRCGTRVIAVERPDVGPARTYRTPQDLVSECLKQS